MRSLRDDRVRFAKLLRQLLEFADSLGVEVALDEGMVCSPRKVWNNGVIWVLEDAVHLKNSFHHRGLAQDILIYRNGIYVADGEDPIFKQLDQFARSLDPWFGLGISFKDSNHVSLGESLGAAA